MEKAIIFYSIHNYSTSSVIRFAMQCKVFRNKIFSQLTFILPSIEIQGIF